MAVKAVTIGFFDGVHIGHRRVLKALLEKDSGARVLTFWPHPRTVLQQDARGLYLLSSLQDKKELLAGCGVQNLEVLDFTREFASLSAEKFIKSYLIDTYHCTSLVLGYDNRLGSDALSTTQVADLARKMGMDVEVVPPYELDGIRVSSTQVRNTLQAGDVESVSLMLGRPYDIKGIVVAGNRLGRTIGFPTANLALSFPLKALPANGVYCTEVILEGRCYRGMTNIGVRPTVSSSGVKTIETHILDFNRDIYGLELELHFLKRIRGEQQFADLEQLRQQLEKDRNMCR